MFEVQRRMCSSCIYRPDSPLDLAALERQIADSHGGFKTFRACHHTKGGKVCCCGFWVRHKDKFAVGQIAQRMNAVRFVQIDILKRLAQSVTRK